MNKSFFVVMAAILLSLGTIGCTLKQYWLNKAQDKPLMVLSDEISTDNYVILTKRLINKIASDDYFTGNNQEKILLYIGDIKNNLIIDSNKTNDVIKDLIVNLLKDVPAIGLTDNSDNKDIYGLDLRYYLSEFTYSENSKPVKSFNVYAVLYDRAGKELKTWGDFLVKSENNGLWQ
ncbi:MAG: hypothetical protein AB7U85_10130 [Alphaproteobacteria bacterium]